MVGRAGRPQFDHEGVAVIMTQRSTEHRYTQLIQVRDTADSLLEETVCCPGAAAGASWSEREREREMAEGLPVL